MPASRRHELIEISDKIVDFDPVTLARRPVARDEVVAFFRQRGQRWAARQVASLQVDAHGLLLPDAVDRLLCEAHAEIQLLAEETLQGERVWRVLEPLLEPLLAMQRARGEEEQGAPLRIVDVGCGLGYVTRWLAMHHPLDHVRYVGVDFNPALVQAATRIADRDGVASRCEFAVANAFTMNEPAHLYTSTGVIHHFRGEQSLGGFFRAQYAREESAGFVHFDIQPSWLSPIGAWIFHQSRFKVRLGRHDGYFSALRAHSSRTLGEAAAREAGPEHTVAMLDSAAGLSPIFRIMHAVVGLRRPLMESLQASLGARRFTTFDAPTRGARGCGE